MIQKEIYSTKSFLNILERNGLSCDFKQATLFPDYIFYQFELKENKRISEFQIYSVTFSVIIESESSCYFIGKKGKILVFMMTFTNDLKKFGLSKTPEKLGKIPKEEMSFDFVKKPLERIVWYKFDTKKITEGNMISEFAEDAKTAEEKVLLEDFWKEITL